MSSRFARTAAGALALALVVFGVVATSIGMGRAPQPPTPLVLSAAPSTAHSAAPVDAPKRPIVLGWRNLKLGMSEAEGTEAILSHRKDPRMEWRPSATAHLPTVRYGLGRIEHLAVDPKRYREWNIRELDDGAEDVRAWYDQGKLVAIQVKGQIDAGAFIRKATEAYGAPPLHAEFRFFDDRSKMQQLRPLAIWRGDDVTAFVWTSGSAPFLLLWSNAAMAERESDYQTTLDAPATAASKAAKTGEDSTKF